jgi:hypothetical protein
MPTTYNLITSNVLGSSAASITFSSIPATYTDVLVLGSVRTDGATTRDALNIVRFNGIDTSIYSRATIQADGSSVSSADLSNFPGFVGMESNGATSLANTFASIELYLASYLSSDTKQLSSISMQEDNSTTASIRDNAGYFNNTSAINSITIGPQGANFVANSSFYLYGIKNS